MAVFGNAAHFLADSPPVQNANTAPTPDPGQTDTRSQTVSNLRVEIPIKKKDGQLEVEKAMRAIRKAFYTIVPQLTS